MHIFTYLHRKYSLAGLALLTHLGCGVTVFAQVGLGLAPMRQELAVEPGSQRSGVVSVSNDSPGPVRVRAQLLDFFIDSEGTPQFRPAWPDEAVFSCRTWLSLNPMEFQLNPGEQARVRFTIRVPSDAVNGSFHCAAGFTSLPPAGDSQGTGLQIAVRIVAAFYALVNAPPVNGTISEVRLESIRDGNRSESEGIVVLENRGTMHFRAAGELSVIGPDGKVLESLPFLGIPVLPKRQQRFLFLFQTALAPGEYTLRARVDIGTDEIQEAVAQVVVDPPKP